MGCRSRVLTPTSAVARLTDIGTALAHISAPPLLHHG